MSQTTDNPLTAHRSSVELTEAERHRLLEVDRRRHALAVVADHARPLSLDELATAVAAHETGDDGDVDVGCVSTVASTLHHVHLPKLADLGLIEYDPDANEVIP